MEILITICARGGSKGIPGKNIRLLNGKPLIFYSIRIAQLFKDKFTNVTIGLSTDSAEIEKVAEEFGLKSIYRRPNYLGGDTVGKIDVIKDILIFYEDANHKRYDYVLDLDVTSPLRNLDDLTNSFKLLVENEKAINLFSVSKANRSPYFNMVEQKENGFFSQVKEPEGLLKTRQAAPEVYDMNASFYFYKRSFFDIGYEGAITDKSLIYLVPHLCFDLDHPSDFDYLSYLIETHKLDFDL